MSNTIRILLIGFISIFLFASCGIFKKKKKPEIAVTEKRSENFDQFYDRFHQDEAFQRSRVMFPLQGASIDGDKEVAWTPENWLPMKVKIYDIDKSQFDTEHRKTPNTFYQKFKMKGAEFYAEYRFELKDGKWFLVYAKDVNL